MSVFPAQFIFLATVGLICSVPAHATSIVLARTGDEVAMAADSLQGVREGQALIHRSVCKIYRVGDVFFAVAGFAEVPNSAYDAVSISADAFRRHDGAEPGLVAAGEAVRSALLSILPVIKLEQPEFVDTEVTNKPAVVTIAAIVVENATPKALSAAIDFNSSKDGKVNYFVYKTGRELKPMAIGHHEAIDRWWNTQQKLPDMPPAYFARMSVQMEIASGDPEVGPPIEVVRLRPGVAPILPDTVGCPIAL